MNQQAGDVVDQEAHYPDDHQQNRESQQWSDSHGHLFLEYGWSFLARLRGNIASIARCACGLVFAEDLSGRNALALRACEKGSRRIRQALKRVGRQPLNVEAKGPTHKSWRVNGGSFGWDGYSGKAASSRHTPKNSVAKHLTRPFPRPLVLRPRVLLRAAHGYRLYS